MAYIDDPNDPRAVLGQQWDTPQQPSSPAPAPSYAGQNWNTGSSTEQDSWSQNFGSGGAPGAMMPISSSQGGGLWQASPVGGSNQSAYTPSTPYGQVNYAMDQARENALRGIGAYSGPASRPPESVTAPPPTSGYVPATPYGQSQAAMDQTRQLAIQAAQAAQQSQPSALSGLSGSAGSSINIDGKQYTWNNGGWQQAGGGTANSPQQGPALGTPSFTGWANNPLPGTSIPGDYRYNPSLVGPGQTMTGQQALQQMYPGQNFSGGLAGFNPTFVQAASPETTAGDKYFPQTPLNPFSFATQDTANQVRDLLAKQGIVGELFTSPHASGTPEQMIRIGGHEASIGEIAKRLMTGSDPSWVYRGLRDEMAQAGGQTNTQYGVQNNETGAFSPTLQSPNAPQGVFAPPRPLQGQAPWPQQQQQPQFQQPPQQQPPNFGGGGFGGGFGGGSFGGGFNPYGGSGFNPYGGFGGGGFGGGFGGFGGGMGGGFNPFTQGSLGGFAQLMNQVMGMRQQYQRPPARPMFGSPYGYSGYYPRFF